MPRTDTDLLSEAVTALGRRVRKLEGQGGAGLPAGGISATDVIPPSAPTGLAAISATDTTITLIWNAAADNIGVISYRIYQNGVQVGSATGLTFTDSNLTFATVYTYTVTAVDLAGNESTPSSSIQAATNGATADATPPSTPQGLAATNVSATSVTLVWNAATDNIGVTGYTVYRNGSPIASPNALTFTDNTVLPSSTYTYTVDAFDGAGNHSGQSSSIIVNTPAIPVSGNWYVDPTGSASNDGSIGAPWSLDYALNGGGAGKVLPGHTVYLRGGIYTVSAAQIVTGLAGNSTNRITVKAYPGERPILRNAGGSVFSTLELRTISYVDFINIEFGMTNFTRNPEVGAGVAMYHTTENAAYTQSNVRFYNCWYHDCAGKAVGSFLTSDVMEWNGCYFYFNGSSASVDWTVHVQGAAGKTKKFKDCVFVHSSADGFRLYSAVGAEALQGITIEGCTFAAVGSLFNNQGVGVLAGGTVATPTNVSVLDNTFHNHLSDDADSRAFQLGDLAGGGSQNLSLIISATADDGTYNPTPTFATTNTIQVGVSGGPLQWGGFWRFQNVTIPQGATITAATLTVEATNGEASATLDVNITGDKSSVNPAAPTSYADVAARARTTAVANWTLGPGWGTGDKVTPSLVSIIQEIVNQGTWASGNALILYADDNASTADIWLRDRSSNPATAGRLTITYFTTTTVGPVGPISNSQDGRFFTDGTFSNTGTTVDMGYAAGVGHSGFVRFQNITIPQGATIVSAHIAFTASGTRSTPNTCKGFVRGDISSANPAAASSNADAVGRARTTASVAWSCGALTAGSGTNATTPDITSVIQEIVNQSGWVSGNAMQIFLDYDATATNYALFASYEDATLPEGQLTITYTAPGTDGGANTVTITGNFGKASRIDGGGSNYSGVTMTGNTWIYTGNHIGVTETRFPSNTWQHTNPSTGQQIVLRPYDWDSRQGNLIIYNWSGAATVTLSATDLAGLNISSGDTYELRNAENYFSDILQGSYNGTSISVPMTGRTVGTPAGGLSAPATYFPYFGVFHIIVKAGTPPPPGGDTTPPTVPTGLTATSTGTSTVSLSWTASSDGVGVAGYTVYRGGVQVGTSITPSFNDSGLSPSTTYLYTVDAYDAAGNHSAQSASASVTTDATPPPPSGANWYIGPSGGSSGSTAGTRSDPFGLSYALNGAGGRIGPGDVVYILNGTYSYSQISMTLSGSSGNPIKFMPEPGAWVKFQGTNTGTQNLVFNNVNYVEFYDIEFTVVSTYTRTTPTSTSSAGTHIITGSSATQSNLKFFGCYFHDHQGMGPKFWEYTRAGIEFNGCVYYYNGQDPQHDHNTYMHNTDGYERIIKDCIFHDAASYNVHCYDDTARPISNFTFDGCVAYKPTTLYGGTPKQNILIGGNGSSSNHIKVQNCFIYDNPSSSSFGVRIGYTQAMNNTTLTGNFSVGRPWSVENSGSYTITNNTIYCPGGTPSTTASRFSGGGNTITTIPTSGTDVFIRKYDWDAKRANIIIYNYASASSITITNAQLVAAGISMANGATFKLRNSQNPLGDIINGTYNGSSISIPMTGRTVATPFGGLSAPSSTFPKFGCFILQIN